MDLFIVIIVLLGVYLMYFLVYYNCFDGICVLVVISIIVFSVLSFLFVDVEFYSVVFFGGIFIGMSVLKCFGIFMLVIFLLLFVMLFEYLVLCLYGYGGVFGVSVFLFVCVCYIGILLGVFCSKKSN